MGKKKPKTLKDYKKMINTLKDFLLQKEKLNEELEKLVIKLGLETHDDEKIPKDFSGKDKVDLLKILQKLLSNLNKN